MPVTSYTAPKGSFIKHKTDVQETDLQTNKNREVMTGVQNQQHNKDYCIQKRMAGLKNRSHHSGAITENIMKGFLMHTRAAALLHRFQQKMAWK